MRLDRIFHVRTEPLINTGASARWKGALRPSELFQQFVKRHGKPLKRLTTCSAFFHRAKAPVLMRYCWYAREISGLGAKHHHPGGMAENSPAFQRRDRDKRVTSPVGTTEPDYLSRPFGTYPFRSSNPALKRRAILDCPSGTKA